MTTDRIQNGLEPVRKIHQSTEPKSPGAAFDGVHRTEHRVDRFVVRLTGRYEAKPVDQLFKKFLGLFKEHIAYRVLRSHFSSQARQLGERAPLWLRHRTV